MIEHNNWEKGVLGQLCLIEIGGTPSRSVPDYWDTDKNTENLWVSIKDLNQKVIFTTSEHITEAGVKHSNVKRQEPGTILLSFKLTIGRVAIAGKPLYTNEAIAGLRSENLNHDFLYQGLQQWDLLQGVDQAIKGATLNKEKIKKIEFLYPTDKPEQSKIAQVLSKVDQAIEQTEYLIAKQERIKTGLMHDLLTRGIDEHGNLRSEETHEFKDSPLGRIPVEWKVRTCASLCRQIVVGIVIRPVQYYKPDGVPMLRSANIHENCIDPVNLVYMSERDNEKLSKSQVSAGDLVTVRTGYPGTTSVIPPEFDGCNCVDIVISRPDQEQISSYFLSIWINSDHGKRQVLEGQGGLAQQHFNVGEMRTLLVKTPPLNEQKQIEKILLKQAATMTGSDRNLVKLHSLKTALMQDLLTGKKRVTPLLEKMEVHS